MRHAVGYGGLRPRGGTTVASKVPTRKRRLLTTVLIATALVAGMALTPMAARAVHNESLFELDGNIADNPVAAGQDWSDFQGPVAPGDTAPVSTVFISDGFNGVNDSIYFGGGSQNNNDITSWKWSCGSVSTKSDIEHAVSSWYLRAQRCASDHACVTRWPTTATALRSTGTWC